MRSAAEASPPLPSVSVSSQYGIRRAHRAPAASTFDLPQCHLPERMAQVVGLGTHRCHPELATVPSAVCSTADLVRPRVAQRRHWALTARGIGHDCGLLAPRPANIHRPAYSARRAGFPASNVLECCTPPGRDSFPASSTIDSGTTRGCPRGELISGTTRGCPHDELSVHTRRVANHKSSLVSRTRRVANHESSFSGVLDPVCSPCSDLRGELPGVMPPSRKGFLPSVACPGRADTGVSGPLLHSAAISCGRERGRGRAPASPRQSRP